MINSSLFPIAVMETDGSSDLQVDFMIIGKTHRLLSCFVSKLSFLREVKVGNTVPSEPITMLDSK